jgi:hypothetical protein
MSFPCPLCETEIKDGDKRCSGCGIEVRLHGKKPADDDHQISNLNKIFSEALRAPIFRYNNAFFEKECAYKEDFLPRISYDDIMEFRQIIRWCPIDAAGKAYWTDRNAEVIVEYSSIQELVADGWRLD